MLAKDWVIVLSALTASISVFAVGWPLLRRDLIAARMKAITDHRRDLSLEQKKKTKRANPWRKKISISVMSAILGRLNLATLTQDKELKRKLAQAGWRSKSIAVSYVFARIATPILLGLLALLYISNPSLHFSSAIKTLIVIGAIVIGFYLPIILLTNAIQKRQAILTRSFPDAMDLLVICVEAGLSIEAAFSRVAEEMAEGAPILAEEIALISVELAFLGDRRQAYDNLSERTGLPAAKSLATSLIQAERYGTSLANALRVLSQENRDSRLAAAEKKAAALPAKLTVPMIIFFLPVLFMIIAGPAAIQIASR